MIHICESCGKKYRIDLEKMTGDAATFKCLACNTMNTVRKPPPGEFEEQRPYVASQSEAANEVDSEAAILSSPKSTGFLGLRGKILILFCLVPIAAMSVGSIFNLTRMMKLSDLITGESYQIVSKLAESAIEEKGRSVAAEVKRYLSEHPELREEDYFHHPVLKDIGIQEVGETGYTCLVSVPIGSEPSKLWLHPLEKLIGADIVEAMKKTLGDDFQRWFNIQERAFSSGKETSGYYMWYDKREKYMTMVPVEGTPHFIASTTYLDEFTLPVMQLQERSQALTQRTIRVALIILAATILFVAIVAFYYGNKLSSNIRYLTNAADRMSVGELNEDISINSKDEIGVLAEAITRMQDSIRISLERFRRRK